MAGAPETGAECHPSMVQKCQLSLLLKTHRSLSCTEKVGPLTIYRMALKHVKHQKMWEFGTANVEKKNKVIMMVGETGSGKTSLINTMVNYIFGVDWKDDYRIQLIEESSEKSQAHSQTSSVTIYQINHEYYFRIPYTITIIDTPGFGDTKNVKQNEKIMRKMREFFHKCKFTEIDAICFVVPSTLAQLTPTQMNIYDNILSIFGNDIKDNIVFFTTFADVQEPIVLSAITETGVLCAKSEDGKPVYFKVNNSMVYANNCPDGVDDYVYNTDEGQWKMGMESTRKFFLHFLSGITSKDFSSTKDVLAERNALEVTLDGLVQKIELVTRKHHELEQTERALNKHKAEIEQNEHFEFEVLKTAKRKINSFVYSTNCQECNFTCHQDCLMYFDPSVCSCEVFSLKGTCSVCGHSSSKHVSENVYWQTFVEPKKKSYFAVKEKYEKVENKVMTPSNVFIKLKDDVNKSEVEVLKLIQEVAKILKRPKEITLKPNPTSAVDYIRLLIEKENKEGTSGFVERIQRLEEAIKIFDNRSQKAGAECRPSMVENCKLSLLLKTHRSLSCTEKVGPLTIYRMALKHVKHQKMWEFGTANVDKKNKVIMMVGETGSGKTSLINTMVNYIFGVDWKDDYRIQLIEESSEKSQAHSQTSSITIYQINHEYYFRIPYTITIIDTPGFGDTKNVKQNEKIMWKMQEFFHKCKFTEIDAICFVVPSTLAQLTPTQMYIYDNILSIFGNDIKDNIVFFTTFADVQEPIVLSAITETGVLCAKSEDGKPVYFKVNNSMVYANNCPDGVDDYVYNTDEGQWKMGMESTRKFLLHFLPGITSKDFSSTKDVLAERNALEVTLDGLVQKIEVVTRKHHELEQTERALNKHKAEIEQNEHFEFEVLKTAKRKINSFVYSTNCQECNFTCHQDCLMYFDPSVCFCEVFSLKGTCSVCGHNFSKHVSENVYWQTFVEPKKKSYFAVKEKYEKVENKVMTPSNVFIKLKDDVNKSEFEVLKLIQEVAKILKRLKEITLKPNPTSAVDYIRLLIEKENKEGTSGFVERIQRLEEAIKIFDNQTQKAGTEGHPTMVEDPGKSLPPNLVNCTSSTSKAGPLTIYRVSLDPVKANRKNKVIMMVGETGSGKSTLINAMINYIFGVEWRDDRRFQVTGAHNQTSNVSIYQINHEDGFRIPYSITFIDTLGFGDTRGIEHDEKIMRKIREFFYKCKFTEIDAICFVVQSSLTRLTPTQAYIFDNLLSIFGNDIKNNIVFFTTFADDQKPSVLSAITKAKIPCALSEDGLPVHFKVNNCMLYANNRPDEVDAQVYEAYERQWKMGMKSIEQFLLVFLPGKASKNLRLTRNVLAERNALEVTLDGLVQKLEELMFKQHELQQTERALNKHKAEIEKNEHFAFELWGTVKIKKYSSEYSTNCHKCNSTCHQDCLVYFDTFVYFCEAFNLIGTCRVCGHGSSRHFSEKFYWQTIVLPIRRTFFALKKIYEEEEKKVMTLENVLQKFKSEIRKAEDEALKLIQEVARILEHLQKIALNPNPVPAVDYIRLLIEKEKREGKSGFMERIELLEKAITNFVANSNIQPQGAGARSNNGLSAVMSYAGQPRS